MVDAPLGNAWLVERIGPDFTLLSFGDAAQVPAGVTALAVECAGLLATRYDARPGTIYLVRPDRYVAARWRRYDADAVQAALTRATGR
jgi:3-(3-hydroxy-phenyl)propionate hydroxylase